MWKRPEFDLPRPNDDLPRNGGLAAFGVPVPVKGSDPPHLKVDARSGAVRHLDADRGDLRKGPSIFRTNDCSDWSWMDPEEFEELCLADQPLQSALAKAATRNPPFNKAAMLPAIKHLDRLIEEYVAKVFARFDARKADIAGYLAARYAAGAANPDCFNRKDKRKR